jgi:hypothetical protein
MVALNKVLFIHQRNTYSQSMKRATEDDERCEVIGLLTFLHVVILPSALHSFIILDLCQLA